MNTRKLILIGLACCAVLLLGAAGNIYYEVLPGLVIKHPVTGATTAAINGTNGTFYGNGVLTNLINPVFTNSFASTVTIDFTKSSSQYIPVTGNLTIATTGLSTGSTVTILLVADGSGPYNLTLPAWVSIGNAAPASIAASHAMEMALTSWGTTDAQVTMKYGTQNP